MKETWTILKALQWTAGYFSRKGIDQPRAGAEVLLAQVLGMDRIELYLYYDRPLSVSELTQFRRFIQRRAAREPTQYITGHQEFWSLDFEVNPSVLIPRPETELLVEKALDVLKASPQLILDLCTGCGIIAVALAHECSSLKIIATDNSPEALLVAQRNAIHHQVERRIFFVAGDLFSVFSPSHDLFDLIVTNPPYVAQEGFDKLAPEIVHYEPKTALAGGALGLDVIHKILREAPFYLKRGGSLLIEIGQGQAEILRRELEENSHFEPPQFIEDYSRVLRVLHLCRR
jgi:release factor glutamine methyltransferase